MALRSGLKAQVHAVLAKEGVRMLMSDLFGVAGPALLDSCQLGPAYTTRVESLRDLIAAKRPRGGDARRHRGPHPARHGGYRAIQALPGVGRALAAVFGAEVVDVGRFAAADKLCCWAGLTPRAVGPGSPPGTESDTPCAEGRSPTRQPARPLGGHRGREPQRGGTFLQAGYHGIAERRGNRDIARVAAARKVLTLVFHGLRDGEIRCLAQGA